MKANISFELETIEELRSFRGVLFPTELDYHQLLITGPPGSGKSTLIRKISGWPEEGFIDLSTNRWWASRMLSLRPREVHLGIPFVGYNEAMAVFDEDWETASEMPQMDATRVRIPPAKRSFLTKNWRKKFVFEFLLPTAPWLYKQRLLRAQKKTHQVDEHFDPILIERQLDTLWTTASYLAHHGLQVYIREGIDGDLKRFLGAG